MAPSLDMEELANSVSHGIGILLSVVGLVVMVVVASLYASVWHIVSTSIYGSTLVAVYSISTLYHSVRDPKAKNLLKTLDHIAIFLLIAGSYTPFMLVNFRGGWGWSLLGVVWGMAFMGIIFTIFFLARLEWVTLLFYIFMGWLIVITQAPIAEVLAWKGFLWLFAGGCCYTLGVFFFRLHRLRFHHAIWHLFVLAGSACHYYTIMMYVLPSS